VLRRLAELKALGRPLYVSLSRKDFLGAVLAGSWEERAPASEREWATSAAVTMAVRGGADVLRLHDASALQAMRIAAAIEAPQGAGVG
jgi:dihydropteroate synthase